MRLADRAGVRGESYAYVDDVTIGGAAWAAGARVGYSVVAVDGVRCGAYGHALALLEDARRPCVAEIQLVYVKPLAARARAAEIIATRGPALLQGTYRAIDALLDRCLDPVVDLAADSAASLRGAAS